MACSSEATATAEEDICTLAARSARAARDGNVAEALDLLRDLMTKDPESALWPATRARLLFEKGEARAALADAEVALGLDEKQGEALVVTARALAYVAREDGGGACDDADGGASLRFARIAAERALALPQLSAKLRAEVEAVLADLRGNQGGDDQEAGECSGAVRPGVDVLQVAGLAAAAMSAWKEGDAPRARALLEELCTADADSLLWPSLLARAHLVAGDAKAALDACARAALQAGSGAIAAAEVFLLSGRARLKVGDTVAAKEDLRRASLARGSLSPEATRELAAAFEEVGWKIEMPTMTVPASGAELAASGAATSSRGAGATPALIAAVPKAPAAAAVAAATPRPAAGAQTAATAATAANKAAVTAELEKARDMEKKGQLVQMRRHCEEALRLEPGAPDAVILLARMEASSGRGAAAVRLLRQTYPGVLRCRPQCVDAHAILASVHEEAGDWDEAVLDLERAAKAAPTGVRETILGCLARAKFRSGDREDAANLAQRVLDDHPTQREACEVACALLMDRGDTATAVGVMIRCLIAHRNEPSAASADLVCGVMRRCSLEELLHVLNPQQKARGDMDESTRNSVAEVVAYIGLILKERSEVREACACYREAALLAPLHASLCLNLMHCFSLRRDNLRALAWGERFFTLIAATSGAAAPAARAVVDALALRRDASGAAQPAFSSGQFKSLGNFCDVLAIGFVLVKLLFLLYPYVPVTSCGGGAEESEAPPWRRRLTALKIEKEPTGARVDPMWEPIDPGHGEAHRRALRQLLEALDSSRSETDLHATQVRNENAYFLCIRDMLALPVPAPPPPLSQEAAAAAAPIFVIGDSHVLSSAWQSVAWHGGGGGQGEEVLRTLVPCLVTGLKIWHLRQASTFYTKFAFWDRITALPPGADIVLLVGEIDCREGILRAVQKGLYANLEAALVAVVDLYVEVVREVRKRLPRGGGAIYIHPVPQVLSETRFLTVAFNQILYRQKTVAAFAKHGARPLEFPAVLEDGERVADMSAPELTKLSLLPELKLDGTHMNPSYVGSHLEPALNKAAAAIDAAA